MGGNWAAPLPPPGAHGSRVVEAPAERGASPVSSVSSGRPKGLFGRVRDSARKALGFEESVAVAPLELQSLVEHLDHMAPAVLALHCRVAPGTAIVIDHVVVASSGIYVITSDVTVGEAHHVSDTIVVGGIDRTAMVDHALARATAMMSTVRSVSDAPVRAVLCFEHATWPLFAKPFTTDGVLVTWPSALPMTLMMQGVLDEDQRYDLIEHLVSVMPHA
ncbi:MAG: hypothetical protein AB7V43_11070 [Acidimicrobiia bacterium]